MATDIITNFIETMIIWFSNNWVETIAALLGFVGIFLQIKQNAWYWLTSIIMVILYVYVFYVSRFYADMAFQFYYLGMSIYGWVFWLKHKKISKDKNGESEITLIVNTINKKNYLFIIIIGIVLWAIIYFILRQTNSDVPLGDSFTTAFSIIASFLLAKKYLENWIFWIVVDVVSAILYLYKGLFLTSALFTVLTVFAIIGYIKWKKFAKNLNGK